MLQWSVKNVLVVSEVGNRRELSGILWATCVFYGKYLELRKEYPLYLFSKVKKEITENSRKT